MKSFDFLKFLKNSNYFCLKIVNAVNNYVRWNDKNMFKVIRDKGENIEIIWEKGLYMRVYSL